MNGQPRTLQVQVRDPVTNAVLGTVYSFSTTGTSGDTGWQSHSVNLSAYAGSNVRIYFVEDIPQNFTGPGQIEFDAVSLIVSSSNGSHSVTLGGGQVVTGVDFGNVQRCELRGTLWEDVNGNGVQDNGEAGLAGRKVYVDENHNRVWDTGEPYALTDANGNYAITGLPPGTYDVLEALPAGWEQTAPSQGTAQQRLFAVAAETTGVPQIVELNPTDGSEIRRFSAPESPTNNSELAYDGTSLFYISGARSQLWQLNPDTGEVIRSDSITTSGSIHGLAALGGKLYLAAGSSLVEFDPATHLVTRVLDLVAANPGISIPPIYELTAITEPDMLLTPGWLLGGGPGILQIDPATGQISDLFAFPPSVFVFPPSVNISSLSLAAIEGNIYVGTPSVSPPGSMAALYVFSRPACSSKRWRCRMGWWEWAATMWPPARLAIP